MKCAEGYRGPDLAIKNFCDFSREKKILYHLNRDRDYDKNKGKAKNKGKDKDKDKDKDKVNPLPP